mmetsp:Transcript_73141/g.143484  ORF Transcript_73141/g.143484 Transcript_73141/m.143484 type:complete len:191 (+) Transcript_73141:54-626(+)
MPKRKAVECSIEANSNKISSNVGKKAATPKTLKDKILAIAATAETLVSLAALKKILQEKYEIEPTTTSNNKLNKTLKELIVENRDDFGKIGGSYHGGENSPAFIEYNQLEAEAEGDEEPENHEDEIKCPFCNTWNNEITSSHYDEKYKNGEVFICCNDECAKYFYSWKNDEKNNYRLGHTWEYRGMDEYN